MSVRENVPLAPLTTLRVGGHARFYADVATETQLRDAIAFAHEHTLPVRVLGAGSNVLVPDEGVPALVLRLTQPTLTYADTGDCVLICAGAGLAWDSVVDAACERALWGVENLAGIPGTVGGAVVQNIGAYGSELSRVLHSARVLFCDTGAAETLTPAELHLGYRTSLFRTRQDLVLIEATFSLSKRGTPNLAYADLTRAQEQGAPLSTPGEVAQAVRTIRKEKFPAAGAGTAGSFFKNPVISSAEAQRVGAQYPGLPLFPQPDGSVKVSLAWLLDHGLGLKGYRQGAVRLYEKQPLVLVTEPGATAHAVDAFARDIAERVHVATGIVIEREVETLQC